MASNTINQGAVNGIVIKPIWGTLDKQEEDDSADRFIAIVESIRKLVDSKADIDHNHDDRYYTEPEIDTKFLAIDVEISQINSKLTPMYGYCETAASVAAKTVTIANFTLVTGRTVYIKFEHENSADDPTLNINGTGAIRIVRYGTDPVSEQEIQWSDGEVKCFTYDGISWIESGGAGGGSDRSDTISFHGSDMIVEPGTNRITFDDSDMIIHPPDGAAWLERTMEALEGGISIISTNNEHAAISNGQYVYIRMHETLPDGLYKATADIAQDSELSDLNVISAAGALNEHEHRRLLSNTENRITTTENDTTANWNVLGNCICYYGPNDQITNKPSRYGILVNYAYGGDVSQLWFTQEKGKIYRRSGNRWGWSDSSKWYELYQENGSVIPIENGGTNATTAQNARANLFPADLNSNGTHLLAVTDNFATGGWIQKASARSWMNAASRIQYPDDGNDQVTRYRVVGKGAAGSAVWWYPIVRLPQYNSSSNLASLIITGRMGGWVSSDVSTVRALVVNRDSISITIEMLAGNSVGTASSVYNKVDIYSFRNTSTGEDTIYMRCSSWFLFDINIEIYQGTILYNGSHSTTTPSGTETARASTSRQRMEMITGKLYVNGAQV